MTASLKKTFKPRIKLNHNIYMEVLNTFLQFTVHGETRSFNNWKIKRFTPFHLGSFIKDELSFEGCIFPILLTS